MVVLGFMEKSCRLLVGFSEVHFFLPSICGFAGWVGRSSTGWLKYDRVAALSEMC